MKSRAAARDVCTRACIALQRALKLNNLRAFSMALYATVVCNVNKKAVHVQKIDMSTLSIQI
jgi:hypothetical protein